MLVNSGMMTRAEAETELTRILALSEAQRRARSAYQPTAYRAPSVILARATDTDPADIGVFAPRPSVVPDWGWQAASKTKPQVLSCPGNHISMMQHPNVVALAALITAALAEAARVRETKEKALPV